MSDIELPEEMFESFSPEEQSILESGGEILLVLDSGNCAQCRYGKILKFLDFGNFKIEKRGRPKRAIKCRPFYWKSLRMCSVHLRA